MKISTILLDWDGCLADTLSLWMSSYLDTYKLFGISVTVDDVITKSWGNCELGPKNIGVEDYQTCWDTVINKVAKGNSSVPLHSYTRELLSNLKNNNCNIAIVTSSRKSIINPSIAYHHLNEYIDFVITEEDVTLPKPDPEMINMAMDFFGIKREECLMVGDSTKDIYAAQNAHIDSALILHSVNKTYYDFDILKKSNPTHCFSNLKELSDFLTR